MVDGVGDERGHYYCGTGLLPARGRLRPLGHCAPAPPAPPPPYLIWLRRHAFEVGPDVLAVERWGLADPLLARLPARGTRWRVGHYSRVLPAGYVETLASGANHLADPDLARYHELLRSVTRGPFTDAGRLRPAIALALGRHDHLVDELRFRNPRLRIETFGPREAPASPPGPRPCRSTARGCVETLVVRVGRGELAGVQLCRGNMRAWSAEIAPGSGPELRLDVGAVEADALWVAPVARSRAGVELHACAP